MTTFDITANSSAKIDFAPESTEAEVIQNVRTLLATIRNTVPYARTMGMNPVYIDDPSEIAKARITADIIEVMRSHEPRVKVIEVKFKAEPDEGKLTPIARVTLNV